MQCVILAGGLGTRMRPHNSTIPKTLLPVAGRPFADWQLGWLRSEGVSNIVYSIGYLGSLIREYVGNGSAWSLEVSYVDESDHLLGTAGALRLALDQGVLDEVFFVLYGDSYLSVRLAEVEAAFKESQLPALMTVFHNSGCWETSNAVFERGCVTRYEKNCPAPPEDMDYVDYGLSVFRREVVADMVLAGSVCDLATVLHRLSVRGDLAGYEAKERFYEVGSVEGLRALEERLRLRGEL